MTVKYPFRTLKHQFDNAKNVLPRIGEEPANLLTFFALGNLFLTSRKPATLGGVSILSANPPLRSPKRRENRGKRCLFATKAPPSENLGATEDVDQTFLRDQVNTAVDTFFLRVRHFSMANSQFRVLGY